MRIKDIEDTDGPKRAIPLNNYLNGQVLYDTLHAKADRVMYIHCIKKVCGVVNKNIANY